MAGILATLLGTEARSHPSNPDAWLINGFGGQDTAAGVRINADSAMAYSAVWRAVRLLSESIATIPVLLYRRTESDGRERAVDHPLYSILHAQPNREQTAFEWREMNQGHLELRGNAYNQIVRRNNGTVAELVPLHPDRMSVQRVGGNIGYTFRPLAGGEVRLRADQVLHFRHLSSDGVLGLSTIEFAKQSLGLSLGAEQYGSIFFRNGARTSGVLEHPGRLSDKASSNLKHSVEEQMTGANRHRLLVLEEGLKWHEIGLRNDEAQFLQTRQHQITEVARWFGVPPHKLADLSKSTFSNIEHQAIEYVTDAILPRTTRIEERLNLSLLSEEERSVYFFEFLITSLLRGDQASRAQFYNFAINGGWMNRNEPRRLENLNPGPPELDEFLVPLNMIPAGSPPRKLPGNDRAARSIERRERLKRAYAVVFVDAWHRVIRRETQLVRQSIKKFAGERSQANLELWLDEFYRAKGEHAGFVVRTLWPVSRSYAEAIQASAAEEIGAVAELSPVLERFVADYTDAVAARHLGASLGILRELTADDAALARRLDEWESKRADESAERELADEAIAIRRETYSAAGLVAPE